ncbi:MAG: hypothetical protein RLZ25_528 [Pseudomonadota bacterium]
MQQSRLIWSFIGLIPFLVSGDVFGGGPIIASVVYSPAPIAVPMLSGTLLIALALLLPAVAFRVLRLRKHGALLQLMIPGMMLVVAGVAGVVIIKDAYAALQNTFTLTNASGGLVSSGGLYPYVPSNSYDRVVNSSGVAIQIDAINVSSPYFTIDPSIAGPGVTPRCLPGMTLTSGGICYIAFGTG